MSYIWSVGPLPKDLLGLGHLTRMVEAGLPFESLRDPGLKGRLRLEPAEREQVEQALTSFATLLQRGSGIDDVWAEVERFGAAGGLDFSRARVLEQVGPRPGGASWVAAGAIVEKALHRAVKSKVTPEARRIADKVSDPRKALKVEHSGRGPRAQEWFYDQAGKAVPLHRNLNALWAQHEVGAEGQIIRAADRADVSAQAELRRALFEDKLGQLAAIFSGHAGLHGDRGALPALEAAASGADRLLHQLIAGADPEEQLRLRSLLVNHQLGALHAAQANGERWFTDRFGYQMALHLPLGFRLAQAAIAEGKLPLEQRRELFEDVFMGYDHMVCYLDMQLCPPEGRAAIEVAVGEHRAALEQLVRADGGRRERNFGREAKGRLAVVDYRQQQRMRTLPFEPLTALQAELAQPRQQGADPAPLIARLEATAQAVEAATIAHQPSSTPAALLAQVDGLLGSSTSSAPPQPARSLPPSQPEAERAYSAYLQSFQTGRRSAEQMAVLEAGLSDPSVKVLHRTVLTGGINAVELVQLSNGLNAIWKPTGGESSKELRELLEPMFQARRERAAYLVDKHMGNHAGAPPTAYRALDGRVGCLQLYVPGKTAAELGLEKVGKYGDRESTLKDHVSEDARRPLALFDQVIGNLDRHGGNFLVVPSSSSGQVLVPIDHGLSLPLFNWRQDSSSVLEEEHLLTPADKAAVQALIDSRAELVAELLELKIDPRAILAMFERVGELAYSGETSHDWSNRGARGP